MSVVGLFHNIHSWNRRNLSNYIEIYIDSNFEIIKKI